MKPSFAIVGAVNHGKSSVAATLAEDDQIGISDFPGETTECLPFDCRGLFTLWDTPGFQDPRGLLREIGDQARASGEPLAVFEKFLSRHSSDDEYNAECKLLRPLLDGAAILYVVDTSKKFEHLHEAEMEILRLTGRPRLAVLNPTAAPAHEVQWRTKLGQHFGAVHEFNAHHASAHDRAGLLRAMAAVADQWRSALHKAAAAIERDWEAKLSEAAQIIVELLERALTCHLDESIAPDDWPKKDAVIEKLKKRFRADVVGLEREAHHKLVKLFRHHRVMAQPEGEELFTEKLFSEETWRVLGMPWWVLAGIGAGAGGLAGAKGGAVIGAHGELAVPSGVPTTVGATVGGAVGALAGGFGAALIGKTVAQPEVSFSSTGPASEDRVARAFKNAAAWIAGTGSIITVGPQGGRNFPYILLDRCLGLFCHLQSRTHARRDSENLSAEDLKAELDRRGASTEKWGDELRDACKQLVRELRAKNGGPETEKRFRALLASQLGKIGS